MKCVAFVALLLVAPASARLFAASKACEAADLKHRTAFQNKLAGVCEDMCKEIGAYPKCTCPGFVPPDATPGVMTWDELLEHMDNLSEWGHGELKSWTAAAKALIQLKHVTSAQDEEKACVAQEQKRRAQIQNKLAGVCEDMCKEIGAYPKCTCPGFVPPDATPGVMTWDELLEHMDNLSEWGHGELKSWTAAAKALIQKGVKHVSLAQGEEQACVAQEQKRRAQIQNKLAGACEDMCKEVGAYPKCTCPGFVPPDATPGVMTWDELLEHMDNLSEWGHGELKAWGERAR